MLGILFYPFPDEDVYNYIVRYNKYSLSVSSSDTKVAFFDDYRKPITFRYLNNLSQFHKVLSREDADFFTLEYIESNFTYLNLVSPFVDEERYQKAYDGLMGSNVNTIKNHKFHKNSMFNDEKSVIKICPICFEEDKKVHGQAYIHRSHNAIGIKTCHKHSCYLDRSTLNKNDIDNLYDINMEYIPSEVRYPNQDFIHLYDEIARNVYSILMGDLFGMSKVDIEKKMRVKLYENEVYKTLESAKHPIVKRFFEKYPIDFLEEYESPASLDSCTWLRNILNLCNKEQNYIRQIFVLQVLFDSLDEIKNTGDEFHFFGEAPYPCLNPACKYFNLEVISECSITTITSLKPVIGSFKCETCGFEYERNTYKGSNRNQYSRVRTYGKVFRQKVHDLERVKGLSNNEIAEVLGVKCDVIGKLKIDIEKNGIDYIFNREKRVNLDDYKNNIIDFINKNPNATRSDIHENLQKELSLIKLRDRPWYDANVPDSKRESNFKPDEHNYIDWNQRDDEILLKVKEVVQDIIEGRDRRRITYRLLSVMTGDYYLREKSLREKLVKTSDYLETVIESTGIHKKRLASYEDNQDFSL